MLRVRVCAAHMGGFWAEILQTRGPFSADFPQTWVGYPEIGKNLPKNGPFSPKFIVDVGMTASFGN